MPTLSSNHEEWVSFERTLLPETFLLQGVRRKIRNPRRNDKTFDSSTWSKTPL